jgi:hypothetical protein
LSCCAQLRVQYLLLPFREIGAREVEALQTHLAVKARSWYRHRTRRRVPCLSSTRNSWRPSFLGLTTSSRRRLTSPCPSFSRRITTHTMASIKGRPPARAAPRVDVPRQRGLFGASLGSPAIVPGVVRQLTKAKLFHKRQNVNAKGPAQLLLQPVPESSTGFAGDRRPRISRTGAAAVTTPLTSPSTSSGAAVTMDTSSAVSYRRARRRLWSSICRRFDRQARGWISVASRGCG